ncbi:Serine/threonine-protein kinase rio1 [Zancudomyces culisetae]|uniref:Serine/threonine-protein kinase RIO1 n=1 Tax=Zancudomyces culisetae TaxID=1213189 RepID=A0A1R1PS36_ZANCU|nr:Serine/threonine-protein kinase rio1 [Zancudomyces culisetae]|eukprot:OMH83703.1 Serine/threonine-protein kinase rio1 [Zancudomyces culisetae]
MDESLLLEQQHNVDISEESEMEFDSDELIAYEGDWGTSGGDFTKQYNKLRDIVHAQNAIKQIAKGPKSVEKAQAASNPDVIDKGAKVNKVVSGGVNTAEIKRKMLAKLESRIHLDEVSTKARNPTGATNSLRISNKKAFGENRGQNQDRANRATTEQVLDPRTRLILLKLLNQGTVYEINGCINTGKEANVYHSITEEGVHRAIKVYKTSILVFKDRDRYFTGEFRFRNGYSRHNPRKMVKLWAEKEMRNLKRIHQAGIPCPEALVLRQHVLVMEFLGDSDGWAYPRLKDAVLKESRYPDLYFQTVSIMRVMYQVCRLVHADLSEYNILYNNKKLYIIDVSQSVEHDHPYALDFLRSDCANINDFFKKHSVHVLSLRQLFEFITNPELPPTAEEFEPELLKLGQLVEHQTTKEIEKSRQDDLIFKQSYIPRNLNEVIEYERDVEKVTRGETDDLLYFSLSGLKVNSTTSNTPDTTSVENGISCTANLSSEPNLKTMGKNIAAESHPGAAYNASSLSTENPSTESHNKKSVRFSNSTALDEDVPSAKTENGKKNNYDDEDEDEDDDEDKDGENSEDDEDEDDENEDSDEDDEDSDFDSPRAPKPLKGKRFLDKQAKKDHKAQIKLEKKEKRKNKIPKAVKKRKEQTSSRKAKK